MNEAEKLAEVLGYRSDGTLFWKVPAGNGRIPVGTRAGYPASNGGFKVMVGKKAYWVHRVVWALHMGELPSLHIDHINGVRSDNRIENLRQCTNAENMQNRSAVGIGAAKLIGAHRRRNKWSSAIIKDGVKTWLGVFCSPEAAHSAYLIAKRELHTFSPEPRAALAATKEET